MMPTSIFVKYLTIGIIKNIFSTYGVEKCAFFFFTWKIINNKLYLISSRSLLLGYFRTSLVRDDALLANARGESDSTQAWFNLASYVWSIGQKASALSFGDP